MYLITLVHINVLFFSRTEDGDDVSQNFERALQSMGAKTRRTFSGVCVCVCVDM